MPRNENIKSGLAAQCETGCKKIVIMLDETELAGQRLITLPYQCWLYFLHTTEVESRAVIMTSQTTLIINKGLSGWARQCWLCIQGNLCKILWFITQYNGSGTSLNTRIDRKFLGKLLNLMFKVPPPSWIICQSFAQNRNILGCILSLSKENLKSRNKWLTLRRSLSYSYFISSLPEKKYRKI